MSQPPWVARELALRQQFLEERLLEPERFHPFFKPCRNRVLIVADGLDFSEADFGLAVFVRTLLDTPGRHVRHEITLAHIGAASGAQMMDGETRIARRIPSFKFDEQQHFTPGTYDVVMLFGIATSFPGRGAGYPVDRLSDAELRALAEHMNGGGGLFATGDHGALGFALSASVPRVRNMRLWRSVQPENTDQVSMTGPFRNDTNRGGLFDNQSDDIPQTIKPRMYATGVFIKAVYPHPLLCGPAGVITVMPDHPHEGECVEPPDNTLDMPLIGGPEYPPAADGGPRPLPELISTNTVPPGNRADVKDPTAGQTFGGICAYDGHRARVGRAVTDATWHHFVNINLVGMVNPSKPEFDRGFLSSAAGVAHLETIRAYYRNLVVWCTRPERIRCMNTRLALDVIYDGKVLEAVLSTTEARIEEISPFALRLIGVHARDVLGRLASRCQTLRLVLDLVLERALPDLIPEIDPWRGRDETALERRAPDWLDGEALLDIALGGALVGIRETVGTLSAERGDVETDRLAEAMADGGTRAAEAGLRSMAAELDEIRRRFGRP